jgi:hypothetical protein
MIHRFCGHETLRDAALCRSCNPHRLSESDFRSCLAAMLDPRKITHEDMQDLSKFLEEAREILENADL